jgi:hypothetical protein
LDEVIQFDTNFEQFREVCQRINPYHIEERYPFFFPQPGKEEVKKSLIAAKELVERILEKIK